MFRSVFQIAAHACGVACLLAATAAPAQTREVAPAPAEMAPLEAQGTFWRMRAGLDALAAGLPSLAEDIFRRLASDDTVEPAVRQRARLELVSALALQRRLGEARAELALVEPPYSTRFRLYQGMLHYAARDFIGVEEAIDRIDPSSVADDRRAWYYLLLSVHLSQQGDETGATAALEQAQLAAQNASQRAHLEAFRLSGRLLTGRVDEDVTAELRRRLEANRGTPLGISFARQYAVALNLQGQQEQALQVLREQIATLTSAETDEAAQLLLLTGLIAGPTSTRGQLALLDILRSSAPRDMQQTALYQLAGAARSATEEVRTRFRQALGTIIESRASPLLDELLLLRAYLRLEAGEPDQAAEDAEMLWENYPGSELRGNALFLLAYLAWTADPPRYRRAADYLSRLRETLPPGVEHARISRLIADCYFLKGDLQTAADAYRLALDEARPAQKAPLRYQLAESLRLAGQLEAAAEAIDVKTWGWENTYFGQANWNLLTELHREGQLEVATERTRRLLKGAPEALGAPLIERLRWFHAYLAFRQGDWARAQEAAKTAITALEAIGSSDPTLQSLLAHNRLLLAQSLLRQNQADAALPLLAELRASALDTDAAVLAYFEQAHHFASRYRLADAQLLLRQMADAHPEHPQAPAALLEAAMIADQQALERTQSEALDILATFLRRYPEHPLVFQVLRLQGDIARKLNRFDLALEYYDAMVDRFPESEHPLYLAHLAAANSLIAQSTREPEKADIAAVRLDRVLSDPQAPVDAQAEAGYLLGAVYAQQNNDTRAREVFWQMAQRFLLDENQARQLGARGRYWISRNLYELAEMLVEAERPLEAHRAYQLMVEYQLPGSRLASARAARLEAPDSAPEIN
ncbi:MAG: tetratricopeptide repeat protein [Opitutales bacterium]